MKITFVGIGCEQLGISMLSSIAKLMGHSVDIVFSVSLFDDKSHLTLKPVAKLFDDVPILIKNIEKQNPDVIVFSPMSATYQWMLDIARKAKQINPNVKTVFGGVHTTAVPDEVINQRCVDYICVGEGDIAFKEILNSIERNDLVTPITNTAFRSKYQRLVWGKQNQFVCDLDSLPIIDKTIWEPYIPLNDTYIAMASRGCPFKCTYCFNSFYWDMAKKGNAKYVRRRSPENMIFELKQAKARYDFKLIEFFDDCFTMNKKWLKDFLDLYKKEINVPFQIFTHLRYIDDDSARWLAEARCRTAQIGVQSFDAEYKRIHLKRTEPNHLVEYVTRLFNKYGMLPKFDHMFGLPEEPIEAQQKALDFYKNVPPYKIQTYWTSFYPGIKMLDEQVKKGNISKKQYEDLVKGKCFDSFTTENALIDKSKLNKYKVYELIFKLIPVVPGFIRRRLDVKCFQWLPKSFFSVLTILVEILIGVLRWDIDVIFYAKFYLYHIYRFVWIKLGLNPKPATKVYSNDYKFFNEQFSVEKEEIVKLKD